MNIDIHNELKEIGSSLIENEKIRVYEPNDDYFEKMQANVFAQLNGYKSKRSIFKMHALRISSIAASVLIISGLYLFYNQANNPKSEIAQSDAYQYLNENIDNIEESTIIKYIEESELVFEDELFLDDASIDKYLEDNPENYQDLDLENLF